jgi:hypothetical protein
MSLHLIGPSITDLKEGKTHSKVHILSCDFLPFPCFAPIKCYIQGEDMTGIVRMVTPLGSCALKLAMMAKPPRACLPEGKTQYWAEA